MKLINSFKAIRVYRKRKLSLLILPKYSIQPFNDCNPREVIQFFVVLKKYSGIHCDESNTSGCVSHNYANNVDRYYWCVCDDWNIPLLYARQLHLLYAILREMKRYMPTNPQ